MVKHFDLYAGFGGFRLGGNGRLDTVGAFEPEEKKAECYHRNFGQSVITCSLERADITVFPCDIVTARLPDLKNGDQNIETFHHILRIIDETKCSHVILESTRRFQQNIPVRTTILDGLEILGFNRKISVLNTYGFGLPQRRECIFVVASKTHDINWPMQNVVKIDVYSILEDNVDDEDFFINERRMAGLKEHKRRHSSRGHGYGYQILREGQPAGVLTTGGSAIEKNIVQDPRKKTLRFLTPREFARLMGFPDNYTLPKSKRFAYNTLASSTPPPLVSAILEVNPSWV